MNKGMKEYLAHFSKELSPEIENFAVEEAFKFSRYIFTYWQGKQKYGHCTHCHKEFPTYAREGDIETCPYCKSECKVKASGRSRRYMIDEAYFIYYEKSLTDPDAIVARGVYSERDYRYSYKHPEMNYYVTDLYIFKPGKSIMLNRSAWWKEEFHLCSTIYSNVQGHLQNVHSACSYDSIKNAVINTPYQYSTWEQYYHYGSDMIAFFDNYSKYPCIEYLTKEGFGEIVEDKIYRSGTYGAINWRANSIFKVLKLNRADLKEFRESKYKDDLLFLKLFQLSKKDKSNFTVEDIERIRNSFGPYYKELRQVLKYASFRKIDNYIKKQIKIKDDPVGILISMKDYIQECKILEMNLEDEHILFPKNIFKAHEHAARAVKVKENKELDNKIHKRVKTLKKYCFQHDNLMIRPANSSIELIDEGKLLHHCVATYINIYAEGKTNIFVIRKTDNPDTPYFTLELRNNEIIQCYGNHDCSPRKDIKEFLKAFTYEKLSKKNLKNRAKVAIPA